MEQFYNRDDGSIITRCEIGKIMVTQKLSITRGDASKIFDTVKISYIIENNDTIPHNIGLRIILDTMLGANDGSPFRVYDRNIIDEEQLIGEDIPKFWVTFDSLENPSVIARGTLQGVDFSKPSQIIFSNWGKLADNTWEVPFLKGQSFQREGEEEFDTAVALYWDEKIFFPGQREVYTTLYGLEYLKIIGDILRVGVPVSLGEVSTAKGQIRPVTLIAYLLNKGGFELKDVKIKIDLPEGLSLSPLSDDVKSVGNLQNNQEVTLAWQIMPQYKGSGNREILVTASALDIESVKSKTQVLLLPPPNILWNVIAPERISVEKRGEYAPNPFKVDVKVRNDGKVPVKNLSCNISLSDGLVLPGVIKSEQTLPKLTGEGEFVFSYKIIADGNRTGNLNYTISISSDTTETETKTFSVFIPEIKPNIEFSYPGYVVKDSFFPVDIIFFGFKDFKSGKLKVFFDPTLLHLVFVSRGTIFVGKETKSIWKEPIIDNQKGIVSFPESIIGKGFTGYGTYATLNFKAKREGEAKLTFSDVLFLDVNENKIECKFEDKDIRIE